MTLPGPVLITGATGFAGSHLVELLAGTERLAGWGRSVPRPELAPLAEWTAIDLLDRDSVQREPLVRTHEQYEQRRMPELQVRFGDRG